MSKYKNLFCPITVLIIGAHVIIVDYEIIPVLERDKKYKYAVAFARDKRHIT